jgi:hypothetical protein
MLVRLNDYREMTTRSDKLAVEFLAGELFIAIVILRLTESGP